MRPNSPPANGQGTPSDIATLSQSLANGQGTPSDLEALSRSLKARLDQDQQRALDQRTSEPLTSEPLTTPIAPPLPVPSPEPSARKKPIALIAAGLGLVAIAAGTTGYHYWQYAATHQATDNATVTSSIHAISARIPGNVAAVLVNDNQDVQAGQPLVKLDARDYQIKLQQAQADLAAAQQKANTAQVNIALSAKTAAATTTQSQGDRAKTAAAIAQARSQILTAQSQVNEAQAGVPKAQAQVAQSAANVQKAQADFDRFSSLFRDGAIAQRDLDTARQALQVAQAQQNADRESVRQAESKLAQIQQSVGTAQAGLAAAESGLIAAASTQQQAEAKGIQTTISQSDFGTAQAAIAQAQVALKNAQLQLSYTAIAAPVTGRIGRKNVEVGQQVQPGTPLLAIVDPHYWITANFKETQLEKMHPGQAVEIKLDSFPNRKFTGHVDSLSPASGAQFSLLPPDNATGNFTKVVQRIPVKIVFDAESVKGAESLITPGMSAEVTVDLQ
jgi:membrane fusion protein (multidrug efflux system)